MHVCKCLRSLRARSAWPASRWPLCSRSSSYEHWHTQYNDRNSSRGICAHWPYIHRSIELFSYRLLLFARAERTGEKRTWAKNYRMADREHRLMTFFNADRERELGHDDPKSNYEENNWTTFSASIFFSIQSRRSEAREKFSIGLLVTALLVQYFAVRL